MAAIFRSTCRLIFVCHRSVTKIISQQKKNMFLTDYRSRKEENMNGHIPIGGRVVFRCLLSGPRHKR